MPPAAAVVVSDAHLGYAPPGVARAFHRFLEMVPGMGSHLVINGDLFEFWFEYRRVIPGSAFGTLERLAAVRRNGVRLTVTGGNHDRWGGPFWRTHLGAAFHAHGVELDLAGLRASVAHGDGVPDERRAARLLQAVVHSRVTQAGFRWLHPDLGIALVRQLGPLLSARSRSEAVIARAAARQAAHARQVLERRPDLDLVILGHTHRAVLQQVGERRWYVNPGAWMEGFSYAVITPQGPRLERFVTT